jgi:hypothetical protein
MAYPAGGHVDHDLAGARVGDDDVDQLDRLALLS